ncbi:hypothetical protein CFIO01_04975 [Colletotrichum fioriniae PJ7]|uniref:2EXR domain-containing protein n=1 Tax=Colletotrichum fioriniae PJ7 TaxID=1445577 RepID=A0A010QFI3_9PEZI|nr:hypothetical protein CFIO01_04975 [Colletotrichum fioriniae PJ7]
MDESAELVKSLTDSLEAINKVQAQQSKAFAALANLCITKDASAADVARMKDLQDTQETLASVVSLQIKIMKQYAAMVLSRQQAVSILPRQQGQEPACDMLIQVVVTGFPSFRRFPSEIRKIIWEMALPDSRVFEPYDIDKAPMLRKRFRPPAILAVCKESREVANEHGSFAFGWGNTIGGSAWFNPKKDVVIIENPEVYEFLETPLSQCQAEILAFHWNYLQGQEEFRSFWNFAENIRSCRRVIILYRSPSNYVYRDGKSPKLFTLQPSDVVWERCMTDAPSYLLYEGDNTWEDVKGVMEGLWHDEKGEDETFPPLEGMELIMCKED